MLQNDYEVLWLIGASSELIPMSTICACTFYQRQKNVGYEGKGGDMS